MTTGQERAAEERKRVSDLFKNIGALVEQGRTPRFMNVSIRLADWRGPRLKKVVWCEIPPEGATVQDVRVQSPKGFDLGDMEYRSSDDQVIGQADQVELTPQQTRRLKTKIATLTA